MKRRKTRSSLAVVTVLGMLLALLPLVALPATALDDHLLLTEIVVTPTGGEFVEIHNPTGSAIDLSDYYLTDATFAGGSTYYYNVVTGLNAGGGGFGDFNSRFPAGSSIGSGEFQTVALAGSIGFNAAYGSLPTYELFEDDLTADSIPDMLEATAGSINNQGGLSNGGEVVILYFWDGSSDLVTDVDYAVWGDKVEAVDKTGISVDGPDADLTASAYADDTAIGFQDVLALGGHASGASFQRLDLAEGTELGTGGNGTGGDDETSENASATWVSGAPTPGSMTVAPVAGIVINEIMQNPAAVADSAGEWFEIYNPGVDPVDINGWTILDNDSDSHIINAGGPLPIAGDGFLVLGVNADSSTNGGVTVDYAYGGGWFLSNSADEVVLLDELGREVDRAEYDGGSTFPDPTGASMALIDPTFDNNVGVNWCEASTPYGSGDLGTPGAQNDCTVAPLRDLVVNEIMQNPSAVFDNAGEWFEIYNPTASDTDIDGWTIKDDGSNSHVINNGGPLLVPAGGFLVLGNNADSATNGGVTVDYSYGGSWFLSNGGDEVVLLDGSLAEVDRVEYDGGPGFPDPTGTSMALIDPDLDNNVGANWCESESAFGAGDLGTPGSINDCDYKIWQIQGSSAVSPFVGDLVVVEAVVVGDYQDNASLDNGDMSGFYLQEEDSDADGDTATSDGIFVFDGSFGVDVAVGDLVSISGSVTEFFGLTEINNLTDVTVISSENPAPTPATVVLPSTGPGYFEAFEGMSVLFPQALTISEYFNFGQFGEIVLTLDRAPQPTAVFEPGSAAAAALALENQLERITLDDGRTSQNPDPALHPNGGIFDLTNTFRGGDTVQALAGVMDYNFGAYKIQPTTGGTYSPVNARDASPDNVGGELTVATFNVLNYFSTIDAGAPICGPGGDQGCRGADNADEFNRQRTKIIDAITTMNADVVGLMEIENHAADAALIDLVNGLNDSAGAGTYDYIATGPVGPDAIRVALIYQPASVSPYGTTAVLDDLAFLDPNNTGGDKNRVALAQSFVDNGNGAVFTVAVNHLKSKGSGCGTGDDDAEQGSCNLTRTLAAGVLTDWLQTDPTNSGDDDFFIIGDLNSYDKEDPIDAFKNAGYRDLILDYQGEYAYSYVFNGQWGYLDYAMASQTAATQVTGTTVWHINSDEPNILDYDTSFKKPAEDALYEPNAFRSSDHDPVIVGLDLIATPAQALEHVLATLSNLLPTGKKSDDKALEKALKSLEEALNPAYWIDDTHLTEEGQKAFGEGKKALQDLTRVKDSDLVADSIAAIVEAFATVAATAIADAVEAGGDQWYIDRALAQMDAAAALFADGNVDQAIDRYKKAWMDAQKALAAAPERFATYNASLNRFNAGDLVSELSVPGSDQPNTIAEVIQRNRPDVLLINEFDYDADGLAARYFQDNYLAVPQNGADSIHYPYRYVAPSNTGIASGFDLNNDGTVGGPDDAFGFGFHEGQYGMVVYSMYPIDFDKIRTFQTFLWKDMPGALLPDDPDTPEPADWFSAEELEVVRLSSKSHWDVPVKIGSDTVHFLVSHPTPPVFDGPEDRNGRRNFDEIRFWADYIDGAAYFYDDNGVSGGLNPNAQFVIAGDQNSDPFDGDSLPGSAQLLLDHPLVNTSVTPMSEGGVEQSALQGQANATHIGDPAYDTADFNSSDPGNLRVDYVLPRINMTMLDAGVYWPVEADPYFHLVGTFPFQSSDHKLVWVDLDLN